MHENADTPLPVRLSKFLAVADNENGQVRIADATIGQLVFGIKCKLDSIPEQWRAQTAMIAACTIAECAKKWAGRA